MKHAAVVPDTKRSSAGQSGSFGFGLCVLIGSLFAVAGAGAAVLQVPSEHATIGAALAAAAPGDTIQVAPGTYEEHALSFFGKDLVLESTSGPEVTIIDANSADRVFDLGNSLTRDAVIEGFTIREGYSSFGGGGIRIRGGAPTIRGNRITANLSEGTGGGLRIMQGANALVENNVIDGNTAYGGGGGIHVDQSTALIRNNDITSNISTQTPAVTGGGVKVTFSTSKVTVRDNFISGNEVSGGGAGISCFVGDLDVIDNEIVDNDAGELGGGVLFEADDGYTPKSILISGNDISRNTAPLAGGAVHTYLENTSSTVVITGNTMNDNESLNPTECMSAAGTCGKGGALGIYLGNGSATQTVTHNEMTGNRADQYGAALMIGTGTGMVAFVFEDNLVASNTSRFGYPALACVGTGSCRIARSRIVDNMNDAATVDSARNPGGAYLRNSGVTVIENNYFRGNTGNHAGAIVLFDLDPAVADPQFLNNSFVDNTTTASFGATLWIEADSTVANNIFTGDLRGIRTSLDPAVEIHNNDFYDLPSVYRGAVTHNTVSALNGESFASGNVDLLPGFFFPDDLYLNFDSLLIDAGRCDLAPADDFDATNRPNGPGCEIGADEYDPNDFLIFADGFESGNTSAW